MNTEHMFFILKVAEYGSINKASQKLFIHQQQLSKVIKNMEDSLNTIIFERTSAGVKVTPQGKKVLSSFASILEIQNALQRDLEPCEAPNAPLKGTLTILSYPNKLFWNNNTSRVIGEFTTLHPEITISCTESPNAEIIETLSLRADFIGIPVLPNSQPATHPFIPEHLTFIPVLQSQIVVYGSSEHPFIQNHKTTSLKALLQEPLALYSPTAESSFLDSIFDTIGKPNIKYKVSNLYSFLEILQSGKAITLGAYRNSRWPTESGFGMVPVRDSPQAVTGLLVHTTAINSPLIKSFCDFFISQSR